MAIELVNVVLLSFLAITAIAIIRLRSLFAVAMLGGIYSLLSAGIFVALDAVDVAFTEAAVGAGVTTIFILGTLVLTDREEKPPTGTPIIPLMVVLAVGAVLVYVTVDPAFPAFGDPNAPVQTHVAPEYLADAVRQTGRGVVEVGLPNIVTSVLASYRGFDTFGEVVVIFTAGIGVLLLLGVGRTIPPAKAKEDEATDKARKRETP